MQSYFLDWAGLLLRWLHLIAGIAWIGASFYFVMLDNSLRAPRKTADGQRGVHGELWAVHGGGFYCSQKFLAGPQGEPLSEDLHWSKWEAYTTWLSGTSLLAVIYWAGASSFLIDPQVRPLTPPQAIGISVAVLAGGWLVYDRLCRLLVGRDRLLAALLFGLVMLADWGLHQVFAARAAYVHVGAMLGTMMVANVFFHIIPGQQRMVAQIRGGQPVDSEPGRIGKQRSVHNTYFTLPVLFVMISNHYPMTYASPRGWLVLAVIMLAGVLVRQFFVLRHRGQHSWWLPAGGVALIATLVVALAPASADAGARRISYREVRPVLDQRCVPCHASHPQQAGFAQPPKGVVLESALQAGQHAARMGETVGNGYMPLGNLTGITADERKLIVGWVAQGAHLDE